MQGFEDASAPLVVIHSYEEAGTCAFCRKGERAGVRCTFGGGRFDGFLCRNDFWKFLRFNSGSAPRRGEKETPLFDNGRQVSP
jgi:hypothetical protein